MKISNNDNNMNISNDTLALHNIYDNIWYCILSKDQLVNKLQLVRLNNPLRQIRIIMRSSEQYKNIQLEDVSVEEDLEDTIIQDFQTCCFVFDDMLNSNQKLIDPFFTRGRHNDVDVYYLSQSYFDLPKRTIRNNSK